MVKIKYHIIGLLLLLGSAHQTALAFEIVLTATPYQKAKYHAFLNGRTCQDVDSFAGKNAFRVTLELTILCKALHYGGLPAKIKFKATPNYSRSLLEVKKGAVAISAATSWLDEIDETLLYKTEPLFASGEFIKGFFTTPELKEKIELEIAQAQQKNQSALSVLQRYPFLSNKRWQQDWKLLKSLNVPVATTMQINKSICKIIEAQRASLYLGEMVMIGIDRWGFPCDRIKLVPIDGLKVVFNQSRHFVVSKKHPNGELIFKALQAGIQKMRASGEILQAQYPLSSHKLAIEGWVDLNPSNKKQ